ARADPRPNYPCGVGGHSLQLRRGRPAPGRTDMHPDPPPDPIHSGRPAADTRRIAFITHYSELYGANLSLINLIEGLGRYGVHSHVICPEPGDLLGALSRRGIPAAVLPFEWWVTTRRSVAGAADRLCRNVRHLRRLTAQLTRWNADLVYSNSSVFAVGALAAAELGLPHVWHVREFGRLDYDLRPDF